jgi:hypothetical protein
MPKVNGAQSNPFSNRPNVSSARLAPYAGVNTTRQGKFEARKNRRWGDWDILEFPPPFLWLDAPCLAGLDDVFECPQPLWIDPWS